MDPTVVVAVIGTLTSLVLAVIAARTAAQARETDEKTTENALVLDAWKDMVNPLRDELDRMHVKYDRLEDECDRLQEELRRCRES